MEYKDIFLEETKNKREFNESSEILKKNFPNGAYLTGSYLYGNIVSKLYGKKQPTVELDYLVKEEINNLDLPENWTKLKDKEGKTKLIGPKYNIHIMPINFYSIRPDIFNILEDYLSRTPLSIQSMVYDINNEELVGENGIYSLDYRVLIPNMDFDLVRKIAKEKGKGPYEYIYDNAKKLGLSIAFQQKPF